MSDLRQYIGEEVFEKYDLVVSSSSCQAPEKVQVFSSIDESIRVSREVKLAV